MTESEPLALDGMPDAPAAAPDQPQRNLEPLTAREKEILLLEQKWFLYPGRKETIVREKFNLSMTRYYQEILHLIEKEAALAWDPITVRRLQNTRRTRQRSRSTTRRAAADVQ